MDASLVVNSMTDPSLSGNVLFITCIKWQMLDGVPCIGYIDHYVPVRWRSATRRWSEMRAVEHIFSNLRRAVSDVF